MVYSWTWSVESTIQDLILGLRGIKLRPAVPVSAISVLGVCLASSMTLVSLVDHLLVRPLAVTRPDRLVQLIRLANQPGTPQESFPGSLITQLDRAAESTAIVLTVGYPSDGFVSYSAEAFRPEPARLQSIDIRALRHLGTAPAVGRSFEAEDAEPGADPVALLGYNYWQSRFRASNEIIGKTFHQRDKIFRIVGVAPSGFSELDTGTSPDVWLPVTRGQAGRMLAVLHDGAGPRQLESSLLPTFRDYLKQESVRSTAQGNSRYLANSLSVLDASTGMRSPLRTRFAGPLGVLAGATVVLLCIGCANVGLLLLALHSQRRREMAIRIACGASALRLLRQIATETAIMAAAASLFAAVLVPIAAKAMVVLASDPDKPIRLHWQWDWRFAAIALAFWAFATVLSVTIPALWLRNHAHTVRDELVAAPTGRNNLLIAVQAALAIVLLAGGGLLQTTWHNLNRIDPGFEKDRLLVAELQWAREGSRASADAAYRLILDQVGGLPGVERVSLSGWSYFSRNSARASLRTERYPDPASSELCEFLSVGPGFFQTMGVPLLRGRDVSSTDTATTPLVAIMNESARRIYFGKSDALGQWFSVFDPKQKIEIAGIVQDTKLHGLREPGPPMVYLPFFQSEFRGTTDAPASIQIRTVPGGRVDNRALHRIVESAAPGLGIRRVRLQGDLVEHSLLRERMMSRVSVALGLLALLLAALGLGGAIANSVARRQKEFGIRLALGATPRDLVGTGVRRALAPVYFGIVAGLGLIFVVARFLRAFLFGLESSDPVVLLGAASVLLTVSAVAAGIPLMGTARIEPAAALRQE